MDILDHNCTPEAVLDQRLAVLRSGQSGTDCFAVPFSYQQYYLPDQPLLDLVAMYQLRNSAEKKEIQVAMAVSSKPLAAIRQFAEYPDLEGIAEALETPLIPLGGAIRLEPVSVPKPWGQEIWYTGVEERGVSSVSDGKFRTQLDWVMAIAPKRLAANQDKQINLLKILDPLPQEVYGDLYFELHERKQEVYVVTHIDKTAWPRGTGAIRFGFDQHKRSQYDCDHDFRNAYVATVDRYWKVRDQIDCLFDRMRELSGVELDVPVPVDTMQGWQQKLPKALVEKEQELRMQMNGFTAIKPLATGDVIQVPLLTPHALQHGVRAVEFQTPVYERKILSFAQKVLTQKHWDTVDAAQVMSLDAPARVHLELIARGEGYLLEQIVDFDDFGVRRLTLEPGSTWSLGPTGLYNLVMSVNGEVTLANTELEAEQSCFLSAEREPVEFMATGTAPAIVLIAEPRLAR